METTNSLKANQQDESSDSTLLIQQENLKKELCLEENPKEDDWLSNQFNRLPFLLYKFWLIVNFPITLLFEYLLIRAAWDSYADMVPFMQLTQRLFASLAVSFIFFLYGGCQMLFAMSKRNSKIAQESVVKFQYDLIGSIMGLILLNQLKGSVYEDRHQTVVSLYGAISAPVHLIGGFAVLKVFKKNHPLTRPGNSQDESIDFLQQNEVIEAEVSKYDARLNTWPYLIYKWWLKFVVVFEISLIFRYILLKVLNAVSPWNEYYLSGDVLVLIGLWISSLLSSYSCFEMEVAMRTRTLAKSKRALALLKICNVLSGVAYIFVAINITLDGQLHNKFESFSSSYLSWFGYIVILPIVSLFGAVKTNKILEQRDQFAKVSNYTNDSYL